MSKHSSYGFKQQSIAVVSVYKRYFKQYNQNYHFVFSLPDSLVQLKALVELVLNDLSLSCLPDAIGKYAIT